MFTNIKIKNIKSFRNESINLKKITLLIGENGSGKSTILQILLLLKQSLGRNVLLTNGEQIMLGSINDILRYNEEELEISVEGSYPIFPFEEKDINYLTKIYDNFSNIFLNIL